MEAAESGMIPEPLLHAGRSTILEYLRSARGYADHHPDLSREQLVQEMARIKNTLDHVMRLLQSGQLLGEK